MLTSLCNRWFYRLHEANDDSGGGLASFEEVFGRPPEEAFNRPNPFDGLGGDDEDDDLAPGVAADAGEEGAAPGDDDEEDDDEDGSGDDAPVLAEWEVEMGKRFAPGTFTEEGWKAYRNLEVLYSRGGQQPPAAPPAPETPPAPAPTPLLGSVAKIETEEQLYNEAAAKPREVAMWAIDNQEVLSPEQYENVMNIWFASNPHQYQTFWSQVNNQGVMGMVQEHFQHETAQQMENAREEGLKAALTDNPLIDQYRQPLGQYMLANPHLNDWVNGLRTKAEVKSAVEAIFYMMAGPELGKQVVEHKAAGEAARLEAERIAAEEAAVADTAAGAARTTRRSAQPRKPAGAPAISEEEYAKGIQDKILNMPTR